MLPCHRRVAIGVGLHRAIVAASRTELACQWYGTDRGKTFTRARKFPDKIPFVSFNLPNLHYIEDDWRFTSFDRAISVPNE